MADFCAAQWLGFTPPLTVTALAADLILPTAMWVEKEGAYPSEHGPGGVLSNFDPETGQWLGRGGTSLALGVLAANSRARAFYENCGARLVSEGTYNWDGHDLPDAIYCFDDLRRLATLVISEVRSAP